MPATEALLKQHLQSGDFTPLYVLYGEETYLTAHYAKQLAQKAAGDDTFGDFNRLSLDGQECNWETIADAVEALPLMAERKSVCVRELDVTSATVYDRLMALLAALPAHCVLILWYAHPLDSRKSNKWKAFLTTAEKVGTCVDFERRTAAELARMLCAGAARRNCKLSPAAANKMVEQCGNDLSLLLNELEKLCAVANEQEITPQLVELVVTRQLSARVYDLSKAIFKGDYRTAYTILHRLFASREEPVSILAVLSGAFVDLYRVKTAVSAGVAATDLANTFGYRGREFVLRNATTDCQRWDIVRLRQCLDLLAQADTRMKGSRTAPRVILEQTVASLIVLAKGGSL